MAYRPRIPQRDLMADTYTDLKAISDSDNRLENLDEVIGKNRRFADAVKDRVIALESIIRVMRERAKWVWWVVLGQLALLAYLAKQVFEWQLGKH